MACVPVGHIRYIGKHEEFLLVPRQRPAGQQEYRTDTSTGKEREREQLKHG